MVASSTRRQAKTGFLSRLLPKPPENRLKRPYLCVARARRDEGLTLSPLICRRPTRLTVGERRRAPQPVPVQDRCSHRRRPGLAAKGARSVLRLPRRAETILRHALGRSRG